MPQFIILALVAAAAGSTAPATQCGAKPFLLNKPVPHHAPAAAAVPTSNKPVAAAATQPAAAKPKLKLKAKPLADCDTPKKG
ncbi:MAG: hypothetical protein ACJ8D5_03700 [Sphingomicrobium sp.]